MRYAGSQGTWLKGPIWERWKRLREKSISSRKNLIVSSWNDFICYFSIHFLRTKSYRPIPGQLPGRFVRWWSLPGPLIPWPADCPQPKYPSLRQHRSTYHRSGLPKPVRREWKFLSFVTEFQTHNLTSAGSRWSHRTPIWHPTLFSLSLIFQCFSIARGRISGLLICWIYLAYPSS